MHCAWASPPCFGIVAGALSWRSRSPCWPVFKKHSERMALCFLALGIAALALAVVENGRLMSMLSLSQAYAASGATDPAAFEGCAVSWRGAQLGALHAPDHRWLDVLRVLCHALSLRADTARARGIRHGRSRTANRDGVHAAASAAASFFHCSRPAGIANLALAVWLLTKGFADRATM